MGDNRNKRRCSFCGRPENEVGLLITGLNGNICDSCSKQAYEIIQEAMKVKGSAGSLDLKELPKPIEIKEFLDDYGIGQEAAEKVFIISYLFSQPVLILDILFFSIPIQMSMILFLSTGIRRLSMHYAAYK